MAIRFIFMYKLALYSLLSSSLISLLSAALLDWMGIYATCVFFVTDYALCFALCCVIRYTYNLTFIGRRLFDMRGYGLYFVGWSMYLHTLKFN